MSILPKTGRIWIVSGMVYTRVKVHKMDSEICGLINNLGFSLCAVLSVCHMVVIS